MPTAAIIPAAGIGVRFGEEKQFKLLGNEPLLIHTLTPFLQSKEINEIIIVVSREKLSKTEKTISSLDNKSDIKLVTGGLHRQDSVYKGLKAVSDFCNLVCIHDGARPFVSIELIESTIKACEKFDGAVAAVKSTDTVKLVKGNAVQKTVNRDQIWFAQTPQTFNKQKLEKAFLSARKNNFFGTDESMLMEKMGYSIATVNGNNQNIKITTPEDWIHATSILNTKISSEKP
ncbi:MAG: 2-C-methyl-D-erythritol 4-phosphate cytidylyltransferase [Candidatus Marinimicrobia bacterium]|jgi:2-C-methyl-D-erythritol 4-phosphate cytidylyltransferase|nr:2-C-methyl-D-erythritol 4-phosphate cytidylyltransferase [Candidatus Neomarinimicrobiota bacterium]|tara:strand:- start:253 stop:945 length:693 start_codon:yes stop_codon:yes gene_type:complete